MKPCKRGNIAQRDNWGHCLCDACKAYNYERQKRNRDPAYSVEYRIQNRDKINAYHREYNKKNRDKRRKLENNWKSKNPEKVKQYNKRGGSKWAKKNSGNKNFWSSLRRASIRKATPSWADLEKIKALYIEAQYISETTGVPHEVDHIYPLQGEFISGLHVENNLQIIEQKENRKKKNWHEYWWLANSAVWYEKHSGRGVMTLGVVTYSLL